MKQILIVIAFTILFACNDKSTEKAIPVKIIFDTDLGPDYDDVGALAFLHAMADSGKAEILATVSSNRHQLVAPSIEVINTWFGRADLPLGAPKHAGPEMGSPQHWADSITARYPHRLNSTREAEDAVKVYRRILDSQPDKSVTIVTVGFLTNLASLLGSAPDDASTLTGEELIKKKVKLLVSMAGKFPSGREFNVFIDSTASAVVFEKWPGNIIFSGFEIGSKIFTGLRLISPGTEKGPVRDVFSISIPKSPEDSNGRMSWDQTAVLIAVYGPEIFFTTVKGEIKIRSDGSNEWKDDPSGRHSYVVMKAPADEIARFIEDRMMHQPVK